MTAVVDTSGAVQERYEYDPYGNCTFLSPSYTARSTSSYGWETLYAGYRIDVTSGLYAVRNRYYHPKLGTWLTRDPAHYLSGLNLYEYPQAVLTTDPFGLSFWSVVGNVALGVVVGVATVAVVVAVAPVAIAAGAAALTAVGVSAATAATVSTAAVSGTLFVAGTIGIASIGIDTVQAIQEGDYDRAGYNTGLLAGGYVAAGSGLGHRLVPAMGGKPTAAPRTWNPIRLCRYEWANRYQPNYPNGSGFFSAAYWATAPTPLSGSMTAAGLCGLQYTPQQASQTYEAVRDIVR